MNRLLIALFDFFVHARCTSPPYKIDSDATFHAPWKAGERIVEGSYWSIAS